MNTKLTLSIDKKTVLKARKIASSEKKSISKLFESYIEEKEKKEKKKAALKRLIGAGKELRGINVREAITDYLDKKYSK